MLLRPPRAGLWLGGDERVEAYAALRGGLTLGGQVDACARAAPQRAACLAKIAIADRPR